MRAKSYGVSHVMVNGQDHYTGWEDSFPICSAMALVPKADDGTWLIDISSIDGGQYRSERVNYDGLYEDAILAAKRYVVRYIQQMEIDNERY